MTGTKPSEHICSLLQGEYLLDKTSLIRSRPIIYVSMDDENKIYGTTLMLEIFVPHCVCHNFSKSTFSYHKLLIIM